MRPYPATFFAFAVSMICFSLVCALQLNAQTGTAQLSGLVTDSTGAALPHASVLIVNRDTGVSRPTQSDTQGQYTAPALQPGHYRITVEAKGFQTLVTDNVTLNVAQNASLGFQLKIGTENQTVTVDGSGLILNTSDASVSTVIDRKFVENIPLNGRSFQSLILLTPGVVTNSPQSQGTSGQTGEFSVNGQRTESNVYTVDGVNANTGGATGGFGTPGTSGSLPAATALGTTQSLVSVDALQEVRVASSSYSAEYGLSPGGQFSFTTRSGTNHVYGTAFDYLRNNYFDANDWFNDNLGKPITALRQNDFGGTLGGPILFPKIYDGRNKSFFFFSYEGLRLTQPQAALTEYVPSTSLRQSAAPTLQPVLNAFPVPTGPPISIACNGTTYVCPSGQPIGTLVPSGLASFVQVDSLPGRLDSTGIRFDQQITSKFKAFFRFSDTQSATETRSSAALSTTHQSSYANTLGLTATLSDKVTNEFRLNYTSSIGASSVVLDNFGGAVPVNLLQLQNISSTGYAEVGLYFPGYSLALYQEAVTQPQHAWNIVDGTTLAHGRQTTKIGLDYRRTDARLQEFNPYLASLFNSSQAVISNIAYLSDVYAYARSYPAYTNTGIYIQDEVRATRRLGVSLGIRWELNPPPFQTSGTLPYIVQGNLSIPSSLSLAPAGTRFWKTTYYNFAPRLGVTYQVHDQPGLETIIRAGGGVFFDSGQQSSASAFTSSPGQSASRSYANASYPLTSAQTAISIANPPIAPFATSYYFPSRLQLPYTLQWNLSLEQALGKAQAITFSYVGSNGRRLLSQQLHSPGALNPTFVNIYVEASGTTSSYSALQIQFQRTLSRGLQVLSSYNWAHSIDFGSQNLQYAVIRGNSDYDLRQNFNIATSYEVPTAAANRFERSLLDNWGVDGRFSVRSGFPIILNGNTITNPNASASYSGLNLIPGAPLYLHVPGLPGNRRINPAAFALPATGQNGNAPRNFVRGFGANQIDLAARRTFPITEQVKLQFRAESFNILNHPNFGYIQPTYGNAQFGEATKMLDQSLGNLNALYQQGGPRSMQFALKLMF